MVCDVSLPANMDLEQAADFIAEGQPNPYHNKKVTGG
jgi:hypothetical protein